MAAANSPEPGPPARVVIADVHPVVDGGRYPVKRVVGEPITVSATILADGHDVLRADVGLSDGAGGWSLRVPMRCTNPGLDRWEGTIVPAERGMTAFEVRAWVDPWRSWAHDAERKVAAGVPADEIAVELQAGAELARRMAGDGSGAGAGDHWRDVLRRAAERLDAGDAGPVFDREVREAADAFPPAAPATAPPVAVDVERERALYSTWYELFPRSCSPIPGAHGTLRDVAGQLDRVASMGFDVLYLPPIHPIGTAFRKGPDNSETAAPGDPGSPWAIGNTAEPGEGPDGGGHCSIHAALGTVADFRLLVAAARGHGMEVALDYALQCSPDHPWVRDHPDWFQHRPDGSIRYAENPPKKYQDVYPLDFTCADWRGLWDACVGILRYWIEQGVTIFRVDNPHTKPFAFWEWLIAEVRRTHPDTIFLSEAFTRPEVMHRLTTIGFTVSYSYFPWRRTKAELIDYFTELSTPPGVDRFRPSAWPNTPDILADQLWGAPRNLFEIRYLLAATLSPSVGIYGPAFELCDNTDAANGKEEYGRSEKYEVKVWDRADPRSIAPAIGELNRIRHEHLALHTLRTIHFHRCDNDQLLVFSKTPHSGPSVDPGRPGHATVLVVASLDPDHPQAGTVALDLDRLGVDPQRPYLVHDLVADRTFTWHGADNYVEIRPHEQVGHVFRITQP